MKKVAKPGHKRRKRTRSKCQPWCVWRTFDGGPDCDGECMSAGDWTAGTRGAMRLTDDAVKIPRVEACAIVNERGEGAVNLSVHGPVNDNPMDDHAMRAAWAYLSPAEAFRIAAAIIREAERAEAVGS